MAAVFVAGNRVTLEPKNAIGKGGEAEVYRHGTRALKIYKDKDHPDLQGDPHGQKAAVERLAIHQRKLPAFPRGLPDHVIAPLDLATDMKQLIVGYEMDLLPKAEVLMAYADRSFCQRGVTYDQKLQIMVNLYELTKQVHQHQMVIGDNNDLNVLVSGKEVYLCDTDAWQFTANGETFYCTTFTNKFVDPLLCNPRASSPGLIKPHNISSDWYAYYVMLFQLLLYVDPYGGIYKPKDSSKRIAHDARPLKRITVFDPEVQYPKPATHYRVLPDDLLQFFHQTFEKDERKQIDIRLIQGMRWTTCSNCGMEHARSVCPGCAAAVPGIVTQVVQVRGQVTATREFKTSGTLLYASYQAGALHYLYSEGSHLHREGGLFKVSGTPSPSMRFRINGKNTLIGVGGTLLVLKPNGDKHQQSIDSYGTVPAFDANSHSVYWISNGLIKASSDPGDLSVPVRDLGSVLENQTLFWVGEDMGFGFYRAGGVNVFFTFDSRRGLIKDSIKLPPIKGQLLDSTCCFSKDRCWFFVSTQESGKSYNRCYLLKLDGTVIASAEGEISDGSWHSTIRGNCAINDFLLVGTDDGLVRVVASGDQLVVSKEFPDTEPWVSSQSNLFPGSNGVYVISAKEVTLLKIQ